jgi:RHS repeat-associated protein
MHMTVMTGYIYDADGNRVAKGAITTWGSCDPTVNGFTTQADYVRDQAGNSMSTFTLAGGNPVLTSTNVYANGALIATDDTNETHFYLTDWLGTRRVQTNYSGVVEQDCMSLPYGDSETCGPEPAENLYTGKARDEETAGGVSPFGVNQGNDYFGARYYASVTGRFLSPDWAAQVEPVPYAKLDDPQSLNLYSYVGNNPLSGVDNDGHAPLQCIGNNAAGVGCQYQANWDAEYGIDSEIRSEVEAYNQGQQQGGSGGSSSGGGFWSHVSNLLHGHAWNYGMRESVTVRILPAEPIPGVTAATDAAGIVGLTSETAGKVLGPAGAAVSIANDRSPKNITTNVLSLIPGFEGMAIPAALTDFMDWSIHNSSRVPQVPAVGTWAYANSSNPPLPSPLPPAPPHSAQPAAAWDVRRNIRSGRTHV